MRLLKLFEQLFFSFVVPALVPATLIVLNACDDSAPLVQEPQLIEALQWTEVYLKRTCATSDSSSTCPGQDGFHVDVEGQVSLGPEFGPVDPAGILTVSERNSLLIAANSLVSQGLESLIWSCEAWSPGPGESGALLRLHDDSNRSRSVYLRSLTNLQICYRGERQLAEALYQAMSPLVEKYGVVPSPTPTPTPSPSGNP